MKPLFLGISLLIASSAAAQTADLKTYRDTKYGAGFRYPANWSPVDVSQPSRMNDDVLGVYASARFAVEYGSRDGEAYFQYAVLPESDAADCRRRVTNLGDGSAEEAPDKVTIAGLQYDHISTGDGGSDHEYLHDIYAVFRNGVCYTFEADAYENRIDSKERPVPQVHHMLAQLKTVMLSVRIVPQVEAAKSEK